MNLTQEEIKNTLALIDVAPINGSQAVTVALLRTKLQKMLEPVVGKEEEKKK